MRIVIKIGTSTITHPTGRLNIRQMEALCKVLSDLKNAGNEVILVSSGAIGMGVGKLRLGKRPADVPTKQAAAAVGQCELMYTYDRLFNAYNHTVAQILLTGVDVEHTDRRVNFQTTLNRLLELGALPIINENDTVATDEITSIGDNDTLAAIVACCCKADLLVLLSDSDGLYTAISAGRLVQFRYKNNSTWTVSPWQLAWEGGCYYLIAYQDEKDPANIRNYRVDRMSYVKVLDRPRRGKEAFAAFDLPSYLRKHFNMFGGPEYRVTLRCTADLEAAMRDRFGQDTLFLPEADGYFHFDVPVCVSDQFYGWVCGFGGKVEITSPAEVRQGLHDMVQELAEQHN